MLIPSFKKIYQLVSIIFKLDKSYTWIQNRANDVIRDGIDDDYDKY
jgi:hypothetical protein